MRSYAVSPLASFVIHSRWPWTVTPRGTTMLKSASQVVFVDGTITPIRFRMLMCHNLADWLICRSSNLTGGPMKLSVQSLTTGLEYHGEVEGKRQRYFVLSSARQYFVMSLSRRVDGAPGRHLNLRAVPAPNAAAAAQYYPAIYW